jgi:hypothetical protein
MVGEDAARHRLRDMMPSPGLVDQTEHRSLFGLHLRRRRPISPPCPSKNTQTILHPSVLRVHEHFGPANGARID